MGSLTDLLKDSPLTPADKERLVAEAKLHEETKAKNAELDRQVIELTNKSAELHREAQKLAAENALLREAQELAAKNADLPMDLAGNQGSLRSADWSLVIIVVVIAVLIFILYGLHVSIPLYISPTYKEPWKNWLIVFLGATAAAAGLWTVWKIYRPSKTERQPGWARTALILWTVLPPLWFWGEYWLLWRHEDFAPDAAKEALERFKHAQELGRNVWIAFVALLAAFYFGGHSQGPGDHTG